MSKVYVETGKHVLTKQLQEFAENLVSSNMKHFNFNRFYLLFGKRKGWDPFFLLASISLPLRHCIPLGIR
jgi:hypothetical protein